MTKFKHIPVLLFESVDALCVFAEKKYIDATFGGGGHAQEIMKRGGFVLGIDQDHDAIENAKEICSAEISRGRLLVRFGNFKDIREIAQYADFEKVSGILFDLGVSSHQLDTSERGFSIRLDGPLDMRMNKDEEVTAAYVVNTYSKDELKDIFIEYGEEDQAEKIAAEIVNKRKEKRIETTHELVAIIETIIKRTGKLHPATKVFQALRIEVNQELQSLKKGLLGAYELLEKKGRIVVITFHSLEDRIVKRTFNNWEQDGLGVEVTRKPILSTENELLSNPRARSAKLRVFQKN